MGGATIVGAVEAPGIEIARLVKPESVAGLRPALTPITAFTFPEFAKFRGGAVVAAPVIFGLEAAALSPVFKAISPITKPVTKALRTGAERSAKFISKAYPARLQNELNKFLTTMRVRRGVAVGRFELKAREVGDDILFGVKGKFEVVPKGKPFRVPKREIGEFQRRVTEFLSPESQKALFQTKVRQIPSLRQRVFDPFTRFLPKGVRRAYKARFGPQEVKQVRLIKDGKFLERTLGSGGRFPGTKIPTTALKTVTDDETTLLIRGLYPVKRGKLFKILDPKLAAEQETARLARGLDFPGLTPELGFKEAYSFPTKSGRALGLFQPRGPSGFPRITLALKQDSDDIARTFFP